MRRSLLIPEDLEIADIDEIIRCFDFMIASLERESRFYDKMMNEEKMVRIIHINNRIKWVNKLKEKFRDAISKREIKWTGK